MTNDLSQAIRGDLEAMQARQDDQDRRLRAVENTLKEAGYDLGDAGEAMAAGNPATHGHQPSAH